mgnify:CR=1 FL=1
MKIHKIFSFILFYIFISLSIVQALEKEKIASKDKLVDKLETLNWHNLTEGKNHYTDVPIANAKIQIYESEYYLKSFKDINQFYWWKFGDGADPDTVFFLQGEDYSIYAYYIEDGYVKLDDWEKIESEDLLNQLKQIAKSKESYYKEKNLKYATGFEWVFDPELNKQNKSISYSYKVFWSDGNNTLESKNFILGKKGYIETSYIVNLDEKNMNFKDEAEYAKDFVNGVIFNDGYKYTDYKSGDKIAAVGVGSLVAGSLGAKVLAKTGFFAKFLPLLLKFWWILLAPLAAFGYIKGKESKENSSSRSKNKKRK